MGDQRFITSGVEFFQPEIGGATYEFQNLDFSENFSGIRHVVSSAIQLKKLRIQTNASLLNSKSDSLDSKFTRLANTTTYSFNKSWVGGKVGYEDNQVRTIEDDQLTPVSQKFQSYEGFAGIGDSTNVFVEAGYRHQINDSISNAELKKVNSSNTYFLKSKLISNENTQLSVFANYRVLKRGAIESADTTGLTTNINPIVRNREEQFEKSLNSRIIYNQSLLDNGIRLNTTLESNNGVVPQQEFTYVKVDPGQGVYTWNDYNNNGIQDLEEFEVAQFQDQAEYVRVLLPNQIFVKIRQNKFSQIVTLNPQQ